MNGCLLKCLFYWYYVYILSVYVMPCMCLCLCACVRARASLWNQFSCSTPLGQILIDKRPSSRTLQFSCGVKPCLLFLDTWDVPEMMYDMILFILYVLAWCSVSRSFMESGQELLSVQMTLQTQKDSITLSVQLNLDTVPLCIPLPYILFMNASEHKFYT